MPKSVVFNLESGNLSSGFNLIVEVYDENNKRKKKYSSCKLEPNIKIEELCNQWRTDHRNTNTRSLNEIIKNPSELPRFYGESNLETKYRAKGGSSGAKTSVDSKKITDGFESEINQWLATEKLNEIIKELGTIIHKDEEVRCIVVTDDNRLKSIPWHLWKLFEQFTQAEIAFSTTELEQVTVSNGDKDELNILAILGNDEGINLDADREFLDALPFAKTEFLQKPSRIELEAKLKQEAIDILFFAGHSKTEAEKGGIIHLNDTETLEVEALDRVLRIAIANGLQLAIFNSCDGLGIADKLAELQIPQVIVMRELVPNLIAQEFLKRFLYCLSQGFPFYSAFRTSRNELKVYEDKFPFASWLPTLFQNQSQSPLLWKRLGLDSILKNLSKTKTKPLDIPLEYLSLDEYEKDLKLYSPAFKFSHKSQDIEAIIDFYRKISEERDAALKLYKFNNKNTNNNFVSYVKIYGGEDISLIDGLIVNNKLDIEDYLKLIKICQEDTELDNLLALVIQALGKIKNKNIRDSILYNSRVIDKLCELVNSKTSELLIWSAATTLGSLNIKQSEKRQNVPKKTKLIANKIIKEQINRFSFVNSCSKEEYEKFINFWLYGPRYQLRWLTSRLKFGDTFALWQKKYSNNVSYNIFDVCWKINQELGMRGILEETILFRRGTVFTSTRLFDRNDFFQGIALELASIPIDWVKYPYKEAVCINYCIHRFFDDCDNAKNKLNSYLHNKSLSGINIFNFQSSIRNWKNLSLFKKNDFLVTENLQQELLIITDNFDKKYNEIINFYLTTQINKYLLNRQHKALFKAIDKFENIYNQQSCLSFKKSKHKIRYKAVLPEEIEALVIVVNRIYNPQIVYEFIKKNAGVSKVNTYNSGLAKDYLIFHRDYLRLIEESLVEPKTLKHYAESLAKIEFLRDILNGSYDKQLKFNLQQQHTFLKNHLFAKEFEKWKNFSHDLDIDYLKTKKELYDKFYFKYQRNKRQQKYFEKAIDEDNEYYFYSSLSASFLLDIYNFTYNFLCLDPLVYNFIKTNIIFVRWKKSVFEAIKCYAVNEKNYKALYENTIVNYQALAEEIVLHFDKKISYASDGIKQIELKKQDIITYTCQLKLFKDGVEKILALDEAIKSNNRSDYITKLTDIAYLPERLSKYKEYVWENYGNLYWDEEEDFIELQQHDDPKDDLGWSKSQRFFLPSILLTSIILVGLGIIGHIVVVGYQLILGLVGGLYLGLICLLLLCFTAILDEDIKNFILLASYIVLLGAGLSKLTWLFHILATNNSLIYRLLSSLAIAVILLSSSCTYMFCLAHFLEQSEKNNSAKLH